MYFYFGKWSTNAIIMEENLNQNGLIYLNQKADLGEAFT